MQVDMKRGLFHNLNAAVQHGPIALPNLLCALSASHKSFVRAIGQLTRS
jgi:hypothetical protein